MQASLQKRSSQASRYFQLPPALAFVSRAITQMQGVGVMLDEDFASSGMFVMQCFGGRCNKSENRHDGVSSEVAWREAS